MNIRSLIKISQWFNKLTTGKAQGKTIQNGFTLVELLIVVAILGILSTAVVTVLNPAELLKRSRDSTRFADIDAINKALSVTNIDNLPLGTPNTIYISIPDSSGTCVNLGLPPLPTGWAYSCATAANFHNVDGTGWMPVNLKLASTGSPLGSLPADPVNTTSSALYYAYSTNGSAWSIKSSRFESVKYLASNQNGFSLGNAITPHMFPEGWVRVPGNGSFGTSDFFVMKYEAKCVRASDSVSLTAPATAYQTYDNTTPCTTNFYPASTPDGFPIANISHDTAKTYCTNIGAHLLTNDEYMTIARNAEQVASNWTLGAVGSGALFSGHNDNAPATALTADMNADDGYVGTGNASPSNQRRTFTLSNGSIIWDMAGNIWQHVQRSTNNVGDAVTTMTLPTRSDGLATWAWGEYGSTPVNITAWTADVARNNVGPSNTTWNSAQGMGQVYTFGNGVNQGTTVFLRGGLWGNGASAGAFSAFLAWVAGRVLCGVSAARGDSIAA